MPTARRPWFRSSSPSDAGRACAAALLLGAIGARAEGEVRGRVLGDHAGAGVVYAEGLPDEPPAKDARATLRQLHLRFVPQECTLGYMQALHGHIREHGLPMALYSDRHGIFRVNNGAARDDAVSQFGRALLTLGIESICANSPQAKGRVERANGVLQDRLLKALRIARISTIDAANAWLPSFKTSHNARFAVTPFHPQDAHVAYNPDADQQLRRILAKHYPRKLSTNLSCQFHSPVLQIEPPASGGLGMRGTAVTVLEHFDHTCEVLWRTKALPHTMITKTRSAPRLAGRKEVCHPPQSTAHPPRANHPWKITPIGPWSPDFTIRPAT